MYMYLASFSIEVRCQYTLMCESVKERCYYILTCDIVEVYDVTISWRVIV